MKQLGLDENLNKLHFPSLSQKSLEKKCKDQKSTIHELTFCAHILIEDLSHFQKQFAKILLKISTQYGRTKSITNRFKGKTKKLN